MTAKNILREGRRKGNRKIKRIGRRAVNAESKIYPAPARKQLVTTFTKQELLRIFLTNW